MKKLIIILIGCCISLKGYSQLTKKSKQDNANNYFSNAMINARGGNFELAKTNISEAIKLDPNSDLYYSCRGEINSKLSDDISAIKDYDKAISIKSNFTYCVSRGNCKVRLNTTESLLDAISDYTASIKIYNGYDKAYFNRGFANATLRNFKEAIEDYDKAIELNKFYELAYFGRGRVYLEIGDRVKACEDFNSTNRYSPNFVDPDMLKLCEFENISSEEKFIDTGKRYDYEEKYSEAIKSYTKAIEVNPKGNLAYMYMKRGFSKLMLKDDNGACEDFNKAKDLGYTDAENTIDTECSSAPLQKTFYESANKKLEKGDLKGALEDFNKSIEINRTAPMAFVGRGTTKVYLEDYKGSIKDFSEAIKLNPEYAEAYLNRGVAKAKSDNFDGACFDLKKAIELGDANAKGIYEEICK